jgi:hypothetical protein
MYINFFKHFTKLTHTYFERMFKKRNKKKLNFKMINDPEYIRSIMEYASTGSLPFIFESEVYNIIKTQWYLKF